MKSYRAHNRVQARGNIMLLPDLPKLRAVVEFAVSVLALAIATLALVVASRQYRLDRSASGGRALVFSTGRTGKIAQPFRF